MVQTVAKIYADNSGGAGGVHLELNQEALSGVSSTDETAQAAHAEQAFEAFIYATYSRLVAAVILIVHDRATAEDIVQETFAKAYLGWPKLWPDGSPAAWSYRVATNLSISWRRRLGRESRAISRMGRPASTPGPEELIDPDLERAVAALPPRQRQAVALHYVLGLPLQEVAQTMKCKLGTAKSMLHAARGRLRKELGE